MTIKSKIILSILMIITCLLLQSYDDYMGTASKLASNSVNQWTD